MTKDKMKVFGCELFISVRSQRIVILPYAAVEFRDLWFSLCGLPAALKSIQIQLSIIGITCQPKLAENDGGLVDGHDTCRQ